MTMVQATTSGGVMLLQHGSPCHGDRVCGLDRLACQLDRQ
jgi:hypothetical protein